MLLEIAKYTNNNFLKKICALILIDQSLKALATALLALAGKNIHDWDKFVPYLIGFLCISLLPNFMFILIRSTEMVGYFDMYYRFLIRQLDRYKGRPSIWANGGKDKFLTAVGPEAETFISAVAFSYLDIFSYVLNIGLNTAALSIVIDMDFFIAFLISIALSFCVYLWRARSVDQVVSEEQNAKLDFSSYVLSLWDNMFLSNQSIASTYLNKLESKFDVARFLVRKSALNSTMWVLMLILAASLPVFLLDAYLAYTNQSNPALIAALMMTLPRQIQVLGVFNSLFQQITNLKVFSARLRVACENAQLQEAELSEFIDLSKIKIDGRNFDSYQQVNSYAASKETGRILVSGANGSGKSSLLLKLHQDLTNSFYLPSSPNFEIGDSLERQSTGEKILKHLDFVSLERHPYILLDEWDANLDPVNLSLVDQALNQLSQQSLIFEIRHLKR